jgi:hypothetical protein
LVVRAADLRAEAVPDLVVARGAFLALVAFVALAVVVFLAFVAFAFVAFLALVALAFVAFFALVVFVARGALVDLDALRAPAATPRSAVAPIRRFTRPANPSRHWAQVRSPAAHNHTS